MSDKIPVYKAEAEAGLEGVITSPTSRVVSAYCPLLCDANVCDSIKDTAINQNKATSILSYAQNNDQFDLHYMHTILATTGWNRNDDVFDRREMWNARNTAEDKPFNVGHDPKAIIGHITGNSVVDENYELVNQDSEFDSLPNKFHILTSAVIYRHVSSRDAELAEQTERLLEEISSGKKWFVSMEALFSDFDYALVDAEGKQNVVSRNEETAFLTKHLRSYGGVGEYEGYRVGRLMRALTFSGKGLVENPGNPESIIFKNEDSVIFKGAAMATPDINLLVTSNCKGESSMSDNNEQVRSLKTQVETLEARLKELDEEKVQSQIATFEKACADKDAEIAELKLRVETANELAESSKKDVDAISEAKAESDKSIAELTEKLDAIVADSIKTNRISTLVDKGVDKAEAESLVETFVGITDEQFAALVSKLSEAPFHYKDEKKKDEDEEESKSDEASASAEAEEAVEATEEAEDAAVLQNAEAEEVPALAVQSEDSSDSVIANLNEYFGNVLGGNNNKDKDES